MCTECLQLLLPFTYINAMALTPLQVKMVTTVADANAALTHIGTCDWIAVGCEGDLSKKGRICLIQVLL